MLKHTKINHPKTLKNRINYMKNAHKLQKKKSI